MRQDSNRLKGENVSIEPLTEPEILALLTREFPPDNGYPWRQFTDGGYCSLVHKRDMATFTGKGQADKGTMYVARENIKGAGPTITVAIADFRQKVLAEAIAVGAVKATPSAEYNNVEAAIFATAFAIQMNDAHKKVTAPLSDGRADAYWLNAAKWATAVAKETVNNYRATIK